LFQKMFSVGSGKLNGYCNVMGRSLCYYVTDKGIKMDKKDTNYTKKLILLKR